jgi:hypothetical protein
MNKIIKSENLRYFIFDTGVTGKDIDFFNMIGTENFLIE